MPKMELSGRYRRTIENCYEFLNAKAKPQSTINIRKIFQIDDKFTVFSIRWTALSIEFQLINGHVLVQKLFQIVRESRREVI